MIFYVLVRALPVVQMIENIVMARIAYFKNRC